MKRYDVYLTDRSYDVYLRNRLTVCDIIVHAITLKDTLSIDAKILLDCCLAEYSIQKVLALKESRMDVVAHIDQMVKRCFEHLTLSGKIEVSAQLAAIRSISLENAFYISTDDLNIVSKFPIDVDGSLNIDVDPIHLFLQYLLDANTSETIIGVADLDNLETIKFVDISNMLVSQAEVDELVAKLIAAGSNMQFSIEATLSSGCYRALIDLDGETDLNTLFDLDALSLDDLGFVEQ